MLAANMPRLKATRQLEKYDAGMMPGIHPDTLFDIVLLVTSSEELANAYRVGAIKANMKPMG